MIIACDFDGTLTTGEMGRGLAAHLPRNAAYWWFYGVQLPRYALAKLRLLEMRRFKQGWAQAMPRLFAGMPRAALQHIFQQAMEEEFWAKRRAAVVAELESYRGAGHRLVIVSGSYQEMLAPFAQRLGADALGTRLAFEADRATGRIIPPLNVGEHKVQRLLEYLGGATLDMAYGDAADDLPMLELSREPVAVYPDARLRQHAHAKGWRILE